MPFAPPQSCAPLLSDLGSVLTWSGKDGSLDSAKTKTTVNGIAIGIVATVCAALIACVALRYWRRRTATKGLYTFGAAVELEDVVD